MILREAREGDEADVSRLLAQLGYPETRPFMSSRLQELAADPDSGVLVCEAGEKVLGFLAFHFFVQLGLEGDFCRIAYFCVDEQTRGQGVGEQLEKELVKRAAKRGCDRIEVHCSDYRTQAHEFYRKKGYQASPQYFVKSGPFCET